MVRLALSLLLPAASAEDFDWEVGSGSDCTGVQHRYENCEGLPPCGTCKPVDCKMGEWHGWSACTCEGLQERNRHVQVHNNECGHPCRADLTETKTCKTECLKQSADCRMGAWAPWAPCTPGKTQTEREREVVTPAIGGGRGCEDCLKETKACPNATHAAESKDCVWDGWSEWSACTCSCDGGQRTRDRSIAQAPRGSGQRCEANSKTEVAPCNTQSCSDTPCEDGRWSDWKPWEACTVSCGGGVQWRKRDVAKEANYCGNPAIGSDAESRPCNQNSCREDIDCQFGQWSPWSACSCSCEGVRNRHRQVSQFGAGNGKWCEGATKQVEACNNYTSQPPIPGCTPALAPPVNCELGDWEPWSQCTASCGGGQQTQTRAIIKEAKNGGTPCGAALSHTQACSTQPCKTGDAIDCLWGDWGNWGACLKCAGQRTRHRTIQALSHGGGVACKFDASREEDRCPRACHERTYCEWGEWSADGSCTATCGSGKIKKMRRLTATTTKPQKLYETSSKAGNDFRLQDLVVSFACGGFITFVAMFMAVRFMRKGPTPTLSRTPEYTTLSPRVAVE